MDYTIKTYSLTGTYKKTLNPLILKNEISFSSTMDGGLGELVLNLNLPLTNTDFTQGDQIKVWKETSLIYAGFIDEVNYKATQFEEIEIRATGYHSLLSRLLYEESSDYTINKIADPASIIDDIITLFNTKYNVLSGDTETVGITADYETNYTTLKRMVDDMKSLGEDYYWYIDENGVFFFKAKPTTATNKLTFEKDIFELDVQEDTTELVNTLHLERKDGTITTYTDSTSISDYGVREKKINNSSIIDTTTADEYGAEYIRQNKDPKKKIRIIVSPEYSYKYYYLNSELTDNNEDYTINNEDFNEQKNIEKIRPGENLQIRNISKDFGTLLITKKTYNPNRIILDLDKYDNLISLIKE